MNPNLPSAFHLPGNLSAKADPKLIADDERHFAAIAASLERSIAELSERLDEARRSPGGTGQAALDRDQEIHRLTARLRALRRYGLDLCLGRIVGDDGSDPVYIGRLGLTDDDGRRLLLDWRAPAAEPFFGATHANPMGLASRRRYRWNGGRIGDYWDEVFTLTGSKATPRSTTSPRSSPPSVAAGRTGCGTCSAPSRPTRTPSFAPGRAARSSSTADRAPARPSSPYTAPPTCCIPIRGSGTTGAACCSSARTSPTLPTSPTSCPASERRASRSAPSGTWCPRGRGGVEADPEVARLKAAAAMTEAIEPAVRLYERPPAEGMTVETHWSEVWIGADDWAEAFGAVEPGTPHNEAREQVWEELVAIIADKHDDGEVSEDLLRRSLARNRELVSAFGRAWPVIRPDDLVGDLWTVPAYLRMCAPWLADAEAALLQRDRPQAWTVSDLPLLDAARRRLGDPEASRRARRREAAVAAQRERMSDVIEDVVRADDSDMFFMSMLRGEDLRNALVDEDAVPQADSDPLAGPFAHVIVDEAQELTDGEWRMLLGRCPARSFTVVGDRAQARRGFTESWTERLERVGLDRISLASLTVNYRTPEEVMAAAEPVIRAALPDANVPTSVRSSGVPVQFGSTSDLDQVLGAWLAEHAEGTACVIGDAEFAGTDRVRSLSPALAKGLEFDLVVLVDPESFGDGVEGAVDRYVAMTRATQRLVVLTGAGGERSD
ncbi:hypothetical protein GCM10029992_57200 [Glycomyces albus]